MREIGAGLLLAANAQKALAKLGLAEAVARLGTPASASEICSWRGKVCKHCSREVGDGTLHVSAEATAFG